MIMHIVYVDETNSCDCCRAFIHRIVSHKQNFAQFHIPGKVAKLVKAMNCDIINQKISCLMKFDWKMN